MTMVEEPFVWYSQGCLQARREPKLFLTLFVKHNIQTKEI